LIRRAERKAGKEINRKRLANRLHISTSSLYAYLSGSTLPSHVTLDGLLLELGAASTDMRRLADGRDRLEEGQVRRCAAGKTSRTPPFHGDGLSDGQGGADFRLWTDDLVPPEVVAPGGYLTGQRPMLYHLREGFFAERPAALEQARLAVVEWIASRPAFANDTVRLPVFWLGGRSGSGKSVLLLQLLSRLHVDGTVRILWLSGDSRRLARAIDWIRRTNSGGTVWALGIDDPYQIGSTIDVAAHWRRALDTVEDLRQNGDGHLLPVVICCGPTEQAKQLADDFPDDIAMTVKVIDNEARDDYERLRRWFILRTGDTPPPVTDTNLLLVQLFFEWHHRHPLTEFARRFRARLTAMDPSGQIEDIVTRVLALNRLYAGYPVRAFEDLLDPARRDKLATLQQEAHLETHGAGASADVWIAHPHLADVIYETWFPAETRRHERREHLRRVIADCHTYGVDSASRTAPLWSLAQVLKPRTGDITARVNIDDLHDVLARWWAGCVSGDQPLPLADLPVWIELAALLPAVDWLPHPVTVAVQVLPTVAPDAAGLRETCHKLLQHAPTSDGVSDAIVSLIDEEIPWHEWLYVAIDALRRLEDPRLEPMARHLLTVTKDPARAADIAWTLGGILYLAGRYHDALSVLDEALVRVDVPPLWQARLNAWRARALPLIGHRDAGEDLARQTLAEGLRLADRITIGHSLHALYLLTGWETGLGYVDEALQVIGDSPETTGLRVALLVNRANNLECLGRSPESETAIREARSLAERTGAWSLPTVRVHLAERYLKTGKWDEALDELDLVTGKLGLFERLVGLGGRAFIAAHRDEHASYTKAVSAAQDLPELVGFMRGNAALLLMAQAVHLEQEHGPRQAAELLAGTVAIDDGVELFDRYMWLPELVRLALAADDPDLAKAAVAAADADAGTEPTPQRITAARHSRAILHADTAALLALADHYRSNGDLLTLGHVCEQAAVLLARSTDRHGAQAALARATSAYRQLDARWDERRACARLQEYQIASDE
jgi:tetratricopeptide (TPR) repeat protein